MVWGPGPCPPPTLLLCILTLWGAAVLLHGREPPMYAEVITPRVNAVGVQRGPHHTQQSAPVAPEVV